MIILSDCFLSNLNLPGAASWTTPFAAFIRFNPINGAHPVNIRIEARKNLLALELMSYNRLHVPKSIQVKTLQAILDGFCGGFTLSHQGIPAFGYLELLVQFIETAKPEREHPEET